MRILSIETSCDETAVAVVDVAEEATGAHTLVAQKIYSQYDEHFDYGGVVPEIASRAHLERLPTLIEDTLVAAECGPQDIDGVAAAVGPGLTGGLLMGLTFAKTLAMAWDKPLIGVNHIEGHALSPLLETAGLVFPYLLVLVSGGHCQIVEVRGVGDYTTLGATRDDAAGECFDKVARLLKLGHPGGPALEKAALGGDATAVTLPQPKVDGLDFSFSGLKTAVAQRVNQGGALSEADVANMAAAVQQTIATHLAEKVDVALAQTQFKTVLVAGGVAANKTIRARLEAVAAAHQARFVAPSLRLCTDNAAMIGLAGGLRLLGHQQEQSWVLGVRPRWPLDEMERVVYE